MTPRPQPHSRFWKLGSILLFGLLLLVGFATIDDYGLSWDEAFRFKGGDAKLAYYEDIFAGRSLKALTDSYPGLFDLPLAWVHKQFPDWGTRSQKGHVWSLSFGLLGLLAVWRLAACIGGERAGFWALLFLATLPRYYGHMFFNPKDIPLAGTYAFGCWALVALFSRLPKASWRHVIWIGVAAGLAMSCRIAGFLILCYFGLFVGLYLIVHYVQTKEPLRTLRKNLWLWAMRGAVAGLIGFAILFVFWPTLHANPFEAAGVSAANVHSYGWENVVLMDGYFWEAQDLPIYYLPYWIVRTTPEHLLLLCTGGIVWMLLRGYWGLRNGGWPQLVVSLPHLLLLFSGIFPLAYIIWKDPVLYDGVRHILFALPPLVAFSALIFDRLIRWAERREYRTCRAAFTMAGVASAFVVAWNRWLLHPYQYVYFNGLSGGLKGAYSRDETDYWGLSHKEAGDWLNQYIEQIDPGGERVYQVHQRYSLWMLREALSPKRFEVSQLLEGADFFVSTTRYNLHNSYPEAELLHVVRRKGVPLCFIYDLREGAEL